MNITLRHQIVAYLARRDGDECWYCGEGFVWSGERRVTLEHLIPLAVLGQGLRWADWNLVLAHSCCNAVAGDRPLAAKFALRDALRRLGGCRFISHRDARAAIGDTATRKQRNQQRQRRRAEVRWRFRASGAPGTALRPFASLGEIAGLVQSSGEVSDAGAW